MPQLSELEKHLAKMLLSTSVGAGAGAYLNERDPAKGAMVGGGAGLGAYTATMLKPLAAIRKEDVDPAVYAMTGGMEGLAGLTVGGTIGDNINKAYRAISSQPTSKKDPQQALVAALSDNGALAKTSGLEKAVVPVIEAIGKKSPQALKYTDEILPILKDAFKPTVGEQVAAGASKLGTGLKYGTGAGVLGTAGYYGYGAYNKVNDATNAVNNQIQRLSDGLGSFNFADMPGKLSDLWARNGGKIKDALGRLIPNGMWPSHGGAAYDPKAWQTGFSGVDVPTVSVPGRTGGGWR